MKKLLITFLILAFSSFSIVNAASETQINSANLLAEKGIIVDNSANPEKYNLDQSVLRQEIAAVVRGLASIPKKETCENKFKDVSATKPNDWACISIEALLDNGIVAGNERFRPEDKISKAEAIGMVVKGKSGCDYNYDPSLSTSWQEQVVAYAFENGIISYIFTDYDTPATRGFIFESAANVLSNTQKWKELTQEIITNKGNTQEYNDLSKELTELFLENNNTPLEKQVDVQKTILELVNAERAKVGVAPLELDNILNLTAQFHAEDMSINNFYSHDSLDGKSPSDRCRMFGTNCNVGENIYQSPTTPEAAMKGWMESPGHKANILDEDYKFLGVGIVYGKTSYDNYWVQVFSANAPKEFSTDKINTENKESETIISTPQDEGIKTTKTEIPTYTLEEVQQEILRLVNEERSKMGIAKLELNNNLSLAAQVQTDDMKNTGRYLAHQGSDGSEPSDRCQRFGIKSCGENVACNYPSPEAVMEGWMNSPGHKANILEVNYKYLGVGYSTSTSGECNVYWAQTFGLGEKLVETQPIPVETGIDFDAIRNETLKIINEKRQENGESLLSLSESLNSKAQERVLKQASTFYILYPTGYAEKNILSCSSATLKDPKEAINIMGYQSFLISDVKYIGIGYIYDSATKKYHWTIYLSGTEETMSSTCSFQTINGYYIPSLKHSDSTTSTKTEYIIGGTKKFSQNFVCNNGNFEKNGSEDIITTCDSGYQKSGENCVTEETKVETNTGTINHNDCSATTINGYSIPFTKHGNVAMDITKAENITGGRKDYIQSFTCNDGIFTAGTEYTNIVCDSGYVKSGENFEICIVEETTKQNCFATSINGYSVLATNHGNSTTATKTESITGGIKNYSQSFTCNDGNFTAGNENVNISCDSGYYKSGENCIKEEVETPVTYKDCSATSINGYSVSATSHGNSTGSIKTESITGGVKNYSQSFTCNNGSFNAGNENVNISCDSGYYKSEETCVKEEAETPVTYKDCSATSINGYAVLATNHGNSTSSIKTESITGGVKNYSQSFTCNDGNFTAGTENIDIVCDSGYEKSGETCAMKEPETVTISNGGSTSWQSVRQLVQTTDRARNLNRQLRSTRSSITKKGNTVTINGLKVEVKLDIPGGVWRQPLSPVTIKSQIAGSERVSTTFDRNFTYNMGQAYASNSVNISFDVAENANSFTIKNIYNYKNNEYSGSQEINISN